jgi:DNA-binding XRE family transcriptional regulator
MQGPQDASRVAIRPLAVVSRSFPARPSSIPEIRDFIQLSLADSPASSEERKEVQAAVADALLEAASPTGSIVVSFRIYPGQVEVDILREVATVEEVLGDWPAHGAFSEWMSAVLRRERLTQEAAAHQLGVSVKTVGRWIRGETRPQMRQLRRIVEVFGDAPPR